MTTPTEANLREALKAVAALGDGYVASLHVAELRAAVDELLRLRAERDSFDRESFARILDRRARERDRARAQLADTRRAALLACADEVARICELPEFRDQRRVARRVADILIDSIQSDVYGERTLAAPAESASVGGTFDLIEHGTFDLIEHLRRQRAFSEKTFGPGPRAQGVVDHIRKELKEIEAEPGDPEEWIDVVLLALDGAWRTGASPEAIVTVLEAKQTKNERRTWPDWRTVEPGKAIEHDRSPQSLPFISHGDAHPVVEPEPDGRTYAIATGLGFLLESLAKATALVTKERDAAASMLERASEYTIHKGPGRWLSAAEVAQLREALEKARSMFRPRTEAAQAFEIPLALLAPRGGA